MPYNNVPVVWWMIWTPVPTVWTPNLSEIHDCTLHAPVRLDCNGICSLSSIIIICKVPYNWPSFILMKNKLMGTSSRKVVVSLLFPFAAIFLQHFAHPQRIQTAVRLVSFSTVSLQQCNIHYIVAKLRFSLPSLSASCVLCLSTCIGGGLTREGK